MASVPVYDKTGAHAGEVEVPEALSGEGHVGLLHQAVMAEMAGQRQGTHKAKTRGEVAGSGKKLWRQKGTGRARVGDRRPPNRVGGGTVTGPQPRSHAKRTSAREKAEALRTAIADRVTAGDVVVLEAVQLAEAKTRLMQELLDNVGLSGDVLLVVPEYDETVYRCGRNIAELEITTAAEVTAWAVLSPKTVVLTREAMARLEARLA